MIADAAHIRASVEAFLEHEAELLDDWKLEEWAALFAEDGEYRIPATDLPVGSPEESLYLVYDNRHRLGERARRLLKRSAHVEFPRSRTLHVISNVRVRSFDDSQVKAACAFVVYRGREDRLDIFPGRSEYALRPLQGSESGFEIVLKHSVLAIESLRLQNKLSIIL